MTSEKNYNSNFCKLLKIGSHIDVDGSSRLCCMSINKLSFDNVFKDQRVFINDSKWIESNCEKCIDLENQKFTSMRNIMDVQFLNESMTPDIYMDIRLNNKCNMACAMCDNKYSTLWSHYRNQKQEQIDTNLEDVYSLFKSKDNIFLHLAGGEPLLIKEHILLLEHLGQLAEVGKKINVQITTNFSIISKELVSILKKFNRVRFCISIDATGKANEYIRHPIKNETVLSNFKKLKSLNNLSIILQPTISILNILNLSGFVDLANQITLDCGHEVLLYPHPLSEPIFLNVRRIPKKFHKKIFEYISEYKKLWVNDKRFKEFYILISELEKVLLEQDNFLDIEDVKKYINEIDEKRGALLKDFNFELHQLLLSGD